MRKRIPFEAKRKSTCGVCKKTVFPTNLVHWNGAGQVKHIECSDNYEDEE